MKKTFIFFLLSLIEISTLESQAVFKYATADSLCIEYDFSLCTELNEDRYLVYNNDHKYIVNGAGEVVITLAKYKNRFYHSFKNGLTQVKDATLSKYGYIDVNGRLIIPHNYDTATGFYGNLAIVGQEGKKGFIDTLGNVVLPLNYEDLQFSNNNLIPAKKNGFYGLIDFKERVVLPFQFVKISNGLEDLLLLEDHDGVSILNSVTLEKSKKKYQDLATFGEQMFRFKSKDKWGLMDRNENIRLSNKFDYLGYLTSSKVALVKLNKKYGVIAQSGEEVLPVQYSNIQIKKYYIIARKDNVNLLFDHQGKRLTAIEYSVLSNFGPCDLYLNAAVDSVFSPLYADAKEIFEEKQFDDVKEISNDLLLAKNSGYWYFYGIESNNRFGPYDEAKPFTGEKAIVKLDGKEYVINVNGKVVSQGYDQIGSIGNYFILMNGEKWGMHDKNSFVDSETIYDEVVHVLDGIFIVKKNDKYGMIKDKKILLPFNYDLIKYDEHLCGYLKVFKEGKIGFANLEGHLLLSPQKMDVEWCWLGLLLIDTDKGKGLMNNKMNYIVDPIYQELSHFRDGQICAAKINDHWGFINRNGETLIEPAFDKVHTFTYARPYAAVQKNKAWYLIDKEGRPFSEDKFSDLQLIRGRKDLFKVRKGNLWGVLDQRGQLVLPVSFDEIKWVKKKWEAELNGQTILMNKEFACVSGCDNIELLKNIGIRIKDE